MSSDPRLIVEHHGHVAHLRFANPPFNHIDAALAAQMADTLEALDHDANCRAIVLSSEGRIFCAGAELRTGGFDLKAFYAQILRLYRTTKPVVAAVQGAAVGAGLGLAVFADFRVSCAEARFSANFSRLGLHPGFGLSVTLPRLIGEQHAAKLFFTGRRIGGEEALRIGLVDELVPQDEVLAGAMALAEEIASSAPLVVQSMRETLRLGLADRIAAVNQRECEIQLGHFETADFQEGVAATAERRPPSLPEHDPLITVTPSGQACGAAVAGVDLSRSLSAEDVAAIRAAWLQHHVLAFPDQRLTDDDLEAFTLAFGGFGEDPFIAPIPGRKHVIAVERRADETSPLFAENWHSDWSFQARPPAGTCLYGLKIPPVGGDTLFANQHAALDAMPVELRAKLEGKMAVHSAKRAYAPDGAYGEADRAKRSMDIRPSREAEATQLHPIIRLHPETGRAGLFSCFGYIIGIDGMDDADAIPLLLALYQWQSRADFQYRHVWQPNMLIMWDNRSVLHAATGGYDGHHRLLHRTTIAAA